jgi:hypothetical protein
MTLNTKKEIDVVIEVPIPSFWEFHYQPGVPYEYPNVCAVYGENSHVHASNSGITKGSNSAFTLALYEGLRRQITEAEFLAGLNHHINEVLTITTKGGQDGTD